jgi:hypothetical protein
MIALLAFGGTAFADELTVEDVILSKANVSGCNTALLIHLNTDAKSSVESVVFTIKLPDGVEFVTEGSGDELKAVSAFGPDYEGQVMGNFLADGSYKVATASDTPLRGKTGLLLAFQIKPTNPSSLSDGENLGDGTISDITFTSQNGKTYPSNRTFGVTVTNRIVLDENSPFELTKTTVNKNILVKRTLKKEKWSTICLPFAMTNDKLVAAFGDDVQVAEFTGCTYNEANGLTLNFSSTTDDIDACVPFLIRVSKEMSKIEVNSVKITKSPDSSDNELDYGGGDPGAGSMSGIFSLTKMEESDLFIQDETFYYAVAGQTIKGFRAKFNFFDNEGNPFLITNASSRGMFLVDGNPVDDATGISSKRNISENKRVYSVTGRFMGENVDMKSLPKGIYIVDGVKIVNE